MARGKAVFLYCRTFGGKEWWCPECGTYNRTRMRPIDYTVTCRGKTCHLTFATGDYLMRMPRGKRIPPPDRIQPLFGTINPAVWRSGQPINRYIGGSTDSKSATDIPPHTGGDPAVDPLQEEDV